MPSASKAVSSFAEPFRQAVQAVLEEDDALSTEGGSTASSGAETESLPKDCADFDAPSKRHSESFEESWHTPLAAAADCRVVPFAGPSPVEAAIAAALSPEGSPVAAALEPAVL